MMVWSAVEMYGGLIQGMAVLPTMDAARSYFKDFIKSNGEVDDCYPIEAYMDGNKEGCENYFYWNDGPNADAEITIWPVDFEMEGGD